MNLFIDTNIFLDFYRFTGDELEELRKIVGLVENDKLTILVTDQVCQEFWRNREKVISDILKEMRKSSSDFKVQFPAPVKNLPDYDDALDASKQLPKLYNNLVQKFLADAKAKKLLADDLIDEVFKVATRIQADDDVLFRAKERKSLGNPPQKQSDNSIGDSLNWEALLQHFRVSGANDCYLVSGDGDYAGDLDKSQLMPYLKDEWKEKFPYQSVHLYETLSSFFKDHFPKIKLASEISIHEVLDNLETSGSFARTHQVVADIKKLGSLPDSAASRIVEIVEENSQVRAIRTDLDVYQLLKDLHSNHGKRLPSEKREKLKKWVAEGEDVWNEEDVD